MIPRKIVDEILSRTDILELISRYIDLKKSGSNFKGLCPFHNEKTPSFMVSPSKQIFHCFGCGKGGNSIEFVKMIENLSFVEAVKLLGKDAGISVTLDEKIMDEEFREAARKSRIKALLDRVVLIYRNEFSKNSAVSQYLLDRGISLKTAEKFVLGYAPRNGKIIGSKEFSEQDISFLEQAGVIGRDSSGRFYEKFSDRLIFPIFNLRGETIGLAGRIMDDRNAAKYLNSQESPVFLKKENFYGIHQSMEAVRKENSVILVEGYLDLICMHQFGFENVLATMGTSLTREQVRLIKRAARDIFVLYDSDEAGVKASVRAGEIFAAEDIAVSVVRIPSAKDPDEFLRKFGAEKLRIIMDKKVSCFEVKADFLNTGLNNESVVDRKKIYANLKIVLSEARKISELIYDDLLKKWSIQYGIREDLLRIESTPEVLLEKNQKKSLDGQEQADKIEFEMIRLAVNFDDFKKRLLQLGSRAEDLFSRSSYKEIVRTLLQQESALSHELLSPEAYEEFQKIAFYPENGQETDLYWDGLLIRLSERLKRENLTGIKGKIRESEESGDYEAMKRWQELYLKLSMEPVSKKSNLTN